MELTKYDIYKKQIIKPASLKIVRKHFRWSPAVIGILALVLAIVVLALTPTNGGSAAAHVNRPRVYSVYSNLLDNSSRVPAVIPPVLSLTQSAAAQTPAPRAYVTNQNSNNVSVIDTGTHIVVDTVAVGTQPRAVAVTPDGTRAYVVNNGSNNVSVIETITNTLVATVGVGSGPIGVAITPNGARAYVTNSGSQSVSVIDTASNTIMTTVPLGSIGSPSGGREPHGIAITPDGSRAYVASHGSASVWVIATGTNTVSSTVNVGGQPLNVAIGNTPGGVRAYVTDDGTSNKVSVINTATNTVVATLTFSNPTSAVAVTPNGTRAYVTHLFTSNVSVIDTATNFVSNLAAGVQPNGVAFAPDSSFAYLTNSANKVYVFDTAASNQIGVVNVGSSPTGVAIAPAPPGLLPPPGPGPAPHAYVTNRFTSNVSVIDTGTDTLVANVRVGNTPFGVAVTSDGSRVYVTNQASNNVSVIATTSNMVVATVAVGTSPTAVAVTPDGSRAYVVNQASNNVSVIDTVTNVVIATVPVGIAPTGVAIGNTSNGTRAYVSNQNPGSVTVIRTDTNAVVATVPASFGASGVAITPTGSRVYVANFSSGNVTVINTATNTVVTTVTTGGTPRYVAVTPDGSRAYVGATSSMVVINTTTNAVVPPNIPVSAFGVAFTPDGSRAYVVDGAFGNVKRIDTVTNTVANTVAIGGTNPEGVAILTLPALSINDVSVDKLSSGTMDAVFTVTLSRASTRDVTVDFATQDGTAVSGVDYQSNFGTLTFNPGDPLTKTITVLVNGNTLSEPDKTFVVNLSNASNAAIADAQGVGTIISPTPPPNTSPTITATTGLTRQQGNPATNSQIATVNDAETTPGTLTVTVTSAPVGILVSNIFNSGGIITADVAADCTAATGNNIIALQVSDGSLNAISNLIINVTSNTAPTLTYATPQSVTQGNSLTINPATGPTDNGSISSIVVLPSIGTYTGPISVDNSTGVVSITNAAPAGSHTIIIRATDNCGAFNDATFTLDVSPPLDVDGDGVPDSRDNCLTTPNPERIAFSSTRDSGDGFSEIYVMNSNGTNQIRLTNTPQSNSLPSFSPNGSKIAFNSGRDGDVEIYVMNADGSNQMRLTDSPGIDGLPRFSPDASKITFASDRDGNREIYVMNADGSNQMRLTNSPGNDYASTFSPDGSKIAFSSERDGNREIYVMNADGSNQMRLTNSPGIDDGSTFSPDGSKITFSSERDGNLEIYVMSSDGFNQVRLTNSPGLDAGPTFSPDGLKIAFYSVRSLSLLNSEIYVMNSDGSNQVQLTNNPTSDNLPSWGRQADSDGDGIGDACDINIATTTTVTSNQNPSFYGQPVTFTATVTPASTTGSTGGPTGTVQFFVDGTPLGGPVDLSNGAASISTHTLSPGSHSIRASYSGDSLFNGSNSSISTQNVNKANTITTITDHAPTSTLVGQPYTVSFTVVGQSGSAAIPSGIVAVTDGTGPSCSAPLGGGMGSCVITSTTAGSKVLTATYVGDSGFNGSSSPPTTHQVFQDNTPPTVTINQAAGQTDPTSTSPINFTAVFSEPVNGFTGSDISFAGSTVGGTLTATVTGSGANYTVSVIGMSGVGIVAVSIPAGAAIDNGGNPSRASTSTDRMVLFGVVNLAYGVLLSPSNGGSASFSVANTGGQLTGVLTYTRGSVSFFATRFTSFVISGQTARMEGFGSNNRLFVITAFDGGNPRQPEQFRLWIEGVEQTAGGGLASGNVVVQPWGPDTRLKGWVDLHTHPMSHIAFGGKLFHGAPAVGSLMPAIQMPNDPECRFDNRATSIAEALSQDGPTHGPPIASRCGDLARFGIVKALEHFNVALVHPPGAVGYPTFTHWPAWNDITHQKMWIDWIRRSWEGGLRVMVALSHNNRTIAELLGAGGPITGVKNDKASSDLQIDEIKKFVTDHSDFMAIAMTPAELHSIVQGGRLAIVLGVEIDKIGDFNIGAGVTEQMIDDEIARLHAQGVRYILPLHLNDNVFGDTAIYKSLFNILNFRENGAFWTVGCAQEADEITFRSGNFPSVLDPFIPPGMPDPPRAPDCLIPKPTGPLFIGHVNERTPNGLTSLGEFAIKAMMKRGIIIDIDHMSNRGANRALSLANAVPAGGYPLTSGHTGVRDRNPDSGKESFRTTTQLARIACLGGMFGLGTDGVKASEWVVSEYARAYEAMRRAFAPNGVCPTANPLGVGFMGIGTDANSLVKTPTPPTFPGGAPRFTDIYNPNNPINAGVPALIRSTTGNRTWDYNVDGVAHYGMLVDFLRDVRTLPASATMTGRQIVDDQMMYGADYFYRMWLKAEAQKTRIP